jgi:hypothetical protein
MPEHTIAPKALKRWKILDDLRSRLVDIEGLVAEIALEAGDTETSAVRALRRRISDEVYSRIHTDLTARGCVTDEHLAQVAA